MRKIILIIIFFGLLNSAYLKAQNKIIVLPNRDSIIEKYIKNGAYRYPIFSKTWGVYLDSALQILPQDAFLWQQKGMPYFKQMKYTVGMKYLDSAVKFNPKSYLDYRGYMKCIFQKDYRGAMIDFTNVKLINGEQYVMDHPYSFYIGLCHLQLNQYDSAFIYFQISSKKNNLNAINLFYEGIANFELGNYNNAITYFDSSLKIYSKFADAKFYKALNLANLSKYAEALALCREAKTDLDEGYTINEGNSKYEKFPYQINEEYLLYITELLNAYLK